MTTAPVVRQIFEMYLNDMGYTAIIKWLKDNEYKTSKGNDFSKSAIYALLQNQKYYGCYTYDKSSGKDENGRHNSHKYKEEYIKISNGCPAIITEDDFMAVHRKMKDRSNKARCNASKHYYPLNGRIYNKEGVQGKKYYQYRCSEKTGDKPVNADKLNEMVFYSLRKLLMTDDNADMIIDKLNQYASDMWSESHDEIKQFIQKKAALEDKRKNLLILLENGKAKESILNGLDSIEREISEIECKVKLNSVDKHTFTKEDYKQLKSQFVSYIKTEATLHNKLFIDSTIDKIEIDNEAVNIKYKTGIPVDKNIVEFFKG